MIQTSVTAPTMCVMLAFNRSNQLAVRKAGSKFGPAFVGADEAMALTRLGNAFAKQTEPVEFFRCEINGANYRVCFVQVDGDSSDSEIVFHSLDTLAGMGAA